MNKKSRDMHRHMYDKEYVVKRTLARIFILVLCILILFVLIFFIFKIFDISSSILIGNIYFKIAIILCVVILWLLLDKKFKLYPTPFIDLFKKSKSTK